MKIEILKEDLKRKTCKFRITGSPLINFVDVKISLNQSDPQITIWTTSEHKEFKMALFRNAWAKRADSIWKNKIPSNDSFSAEPEFDFMKDIFPIILDEIDKFKLKLDIIKNQSWLFLWLEKEFFPGLLDSE